MPPPDETNAVQPFEHRAGTELRHAAGENRLRAEWPDAVALEPVDTGALHVRHEHAVVVTGDLFSESAG